MLKEDGVSTPLPISFTPRKTSLHQPTQLIGFCVWVPVLLRVAGGSSREALMIVPCVQVSRASVTVA